MARCNDRERNRGDHENDGTPRCGLAKEGSRATRSEGSLAALSAECSGDVLAFTALQENDTDDYEADDYVDYCHQDCENLH